MTQFVLLYRSTTAVRDDAFDDAERQKTLGKWRGWLQEIAAKGQLKSAGEALDHKGKVVAGKARTVQDGPFAETKEVIGGFSIVEAKDIDEAIAFASGCPILERGGSVEVRPVLQLGS